LFRGASIGSNVWNDANGNGIQDPSEEPIGGVTVQLFDSNGNLVDTTTTNDNGVYDFSGLVPGDYYVQFVTPDGFVPTRANQGEDDALDSDVDPQTLRSGVTTLDAGENDPTWDAGFTVPASIGNSVWDDGPEATNGSGCWGERNPSVTVILYDAAGDEVDRTTTAADGSRSRLIPESIRLNSSYRPVSKALLCRTEAVMRPLTVMWIRTQAALS
ncbi:carboxypeptidase regulatory-like domain-containing protein, partial [Chloroflexi bacterium TSY]|nr:carboxypeptidase regulatory-like domain-containing protein [Chloroflexi bacterium TSY]